MEAVGELLRDASAARFRASTRPRIRAAVRTSMWLAALAVVVDGAWLLPGHHEDAARILGANAGVAALALLAFWALGRYRSLPAEAALFVVLLAVDAAIALVIGIDVGISLLCAGYVLLLPPVVALLIPWRTRFHVAWLVVHALAAIILCGLVPAEAIAIDGPRTLLALLVVSSAGSVLGHIANLRARVASFALIEQVRSMNRRARRDEASLRQLNARLEEVAWSDQLTGLGNRLALRRQLARIRSRIQRYGDRYALLMLDLDHFKLINDRLGHVAGDDVLRRVACATDEATRASDATYRFGGDELVEVVALARPDEAPIVAERVRRAVERLRIDHPGNPPFGVATVSIGVTVIDSAALEESEDTWLQHADEALYEAKRRGRNRIVIV